MKQIQKGPECRPLAAWRQANVHTPQNLIYGVAEFPRHEVLESLLREQGWLCAYTLKRIDATSSHVEHIKPQTLCRSEDDQRELAQQARRRQDIAWANMVACFPAPNDPAPEYGAVKKADWWPADDAATFVSPLNPDCESRFAFELNGEMKPANAADVAAEVMIKEIGLNNAKLSELRRRALIEMGLHPKSERPLKSAAKVRHLVAAWIQRDDDNKFREFCVPLRFVA